jgi:hypothetical protein
LRFVISFAFGYYYIAVPYKPLLVLDDANHTICSWDAGRGCAKFNQQIKISETAQPARHSLLQKT